ncbi:MAG: hypothetical protein HDS96_05680 [Bacteroidales bacterium]|nr:hypothetical protein [Bacteroidales bacterium]
MKNLKNARSALTLLLAATAFAAGAKVPAAVDRAVGQIKAAPAIDVECTINGHAASATLCGDMFAFDFGQARVFYDGQTQWSYSPADKEVTVFTPTAAELAESNPLRILSRLASDYSGAAVNGRPNTVRLSALNPKNQINEVTVTFNPQTGWPTEMTIISGGSRAELRNFRFAPSKTKKPVEAFRFQAPKGTTINDLR